MLWDAFKIALLFKDQYGHRELEREMPCFWRVNLKTVGFSSLFIYTERLKFFCVSVEFMLESVVSWLARSARSHLTRFVYRFVPLHCTN